MSSPAHLRQRVGADAIQEKGWLAANKWLLARRACQVSILMLFLLGPWYGIWIVKGNLSSSMTLDVLSLTDPFVFLQMLFSGHSPETTAITGAAIVAAFYMLVGGRVYCSWVCPVNMVTDAAHWLRERLGLRGASHLPRSTRYWIMTTLLLLTFATGTIVWETVNPVSMLHRGIIFGIGLAWLVILAVFLFDLLVSRRGWCGHLCPMGACYSLLAVRSVVRVRADARSNCNDCMDCFMVCPEQQVIRPALKGADKDIGPVITSPNCTNCGRCIDVCSKNVFHFGTRFENTCTDANTEHNTTRKRTHHSSEAEALQ